VVVGTAVPLAGQTPWRLVDHDVSFEIHNAGLPVRGTFENLDVEIAFDPAEPASGSFVGRIDPASIETGIAMRDRHLAGRQFFDVRTFPHMEMRSASIAPTDRPGWFRGEFDVVIRDVTRRVPVLFRFEEAGDGASLSGELSVDRVEFGVGDGGFLLGDEVTVTVEVELERATGRP